MRTGAGSRIPQRDDPAQPGSGRSPRLANMTTSNLYDDCVRRHALERPKATAIVTSAGDLSYGRLHERCLARQRSLARHGISAENLPCLCFEDPIELAVTVLALARMGCPIFVVPRALPARQRLAWMALARCTLVVGDVEPEEFAEGGGAFFKVAVSADEAGDVEDGEAPVIPEDRCQLLIGGSGSTGEAKLIAVTRGQLHHRLIDIIESLGLTPADLMVNAFTLDYASGLHLYLSVMASGGRAALGITGRNVIQWMQDHEATVMIAGSVHVEQLLTMARNRPAPVLPAIRVLGMGGSTVSDALRARITERLTKNLYVIWGSNEVWYATVATPAMVASTPGTIGMPTAGARVEVVGPDDTPVQPGNVGEIRVSGPSVASGYVGNDAGTSAAFRNGWFYPGDLGRLLDDRQIAFLGRKDNVMIMNGVNIHPAEIERCALEYPGIDEAFAFPLRHPIHQDVPCCAVSVRNDTAFDLEGLGRHLARELGLRRPRILYLFDTMPRSAHGKISRQEIARALHAKREKRSLTI